MQGSWPVLRRAQFDDALSSFTTQRGAFLYGEAGIGTTQLAREVQDALNSGPSESYAWYSVLGSPTEVDIPLSSLNHLVPGVDVSAGQSSQQLAFSAYKHLSSQAGGRRIAILVEEAHLLDDTSAEVLAQLCRLENVYLLGTVRSGRTPADPIVKLWREDLLIRIDVPPFSIDEVAAAVWAALDGPVDSFLIRELHRSSDGNPMYVRELVRAGIAERTIKQKHGVWMRTGTAQPAKQLVDLIAAEMGQLTQPERDAVELIALAEPVTVTLARPLIDGEALDRLVSDGLVRVEDATLDGQFSRQTLRLSHPIYAECVRSMIGPERRRALYEEVRTDTPPAQHQTVNGFLRWTAWTLECGFEISFTDLMRAARAASSLGQFEFAIDAATAAFERSVDTLSAAEAMAARARELLLLDRPHEALRDVDVALRLLRATPTSLDESRAELILTIHELRADVEQYGLDDPEGAVATIDRVYGSLIAQGARTQHAERYRVSRATRLGWAGQLDAPLASTAELDDALPVVAPAILALTWAGRSTEAIALGSHYEPMGGSTAVNVSRSRPAIQMVTFFSHLVSGRLDIAKTMAPDPRSISESALTHPAVMYSCSARLLAAEGRWRDADERFRIARRLFDVRDPFGLSAWSMGAEAFSAAQVGEGGRARELILRIDHTPRRSSRAFEADIRTQVVGTLLALKDPEAADRATALTRWAHRKGFALTELFGLDLAVLADPESGRTPATTDRLLELSSIVNAPIATPLANHALAVINADPALVAAATAQLGQLGYWIPSRPAMSHTLSRRESEVATLVAAGLSSPAIAERLHLSVRTVETHVSRTFTKLGINRRSQLAEALRRHRA